MRKFLTKAQHALQIIEQISAFKGKPYTLSTIESKGLSLSYAEQVVARMKAKGLIIAKRGPGGGYFLARPADQITVMDVIEAVYDIGELNRTQRKPFVDLLGAALYAAQKMTVQDVVTKSNAA